MHTAGVTEFSGDIHRCVFSSLHSEQRYIPTVIADYLNHWDAPTETHVALFVHEILTADFSVVDPRSHDAYIRSGRRVYSTTPTCMAGLGQCQRNTLSVTTSPGCHPRRPQKGHRGFLTPRLSNSAWNCRHCSSFSGIAGYPPTRSLFILE